MRRSKQGESLQDRSGKIASVAAVLVVALWLALDAFGLGTPAVDVPDGAAAVVKAEAPAPGAVEAVPHLPALAVGDVIAPEHVDQLPEHQAACTLSSGEMVVVERRRPLPDPVLREVTSILARADLDDVRGTLELTRDARARIREIQHQTGRVVVPVREAGSYDARDALRYTFWTPVFVDGAADVVAMDRATDHAVDQKATPEEAVAYAQGVVARTPYAASYDIVVVR
ncbi:hypothetical protein [Cellulosimicrobium cellulans]|uniref:hypothetical protein n=1 Tax=Cellulosimicrobium cellulans TaxID=1710 RepID=UPI001495AE7B|nr:hypothetical protein [Cellulosimicrobium cellulans]